jgi:hypothetical protein
MADKEIKFSGTKGIKLTLEHGVRDSSRGWSERRRGAQTWERRTGVKGGGVL